MTSGATLHDVVVLVLMVVISGLVLVLALFFVGK